MRITGGELCGRNVTCPPGIIRPAMDRMRESLFAVLGPLDGLSFLDLFTGSGVIGLEAWSRGARPIRCVEKDPGKKETIVRNLSMAGDTAFLSIMPVERFIMSWKEPFNIIFLDPPFDYPHKQELLERICASRLLAPWSKVLMHYPDENRIADHIAAKGSSGPDGKGKTGSRTLDLYDKRVYGRSVVHFYQANELES